MVSTEEDVRRVLAESDPGTVDPDETTGWKGDEHAEPGTRGWTA